MSEQGIELREIVVRRGDTVALDNISVLFPSGKTTVILGPAGSGKSTLLKVAAGIILPDSGRVLVEGKSLSTMSERENNEFRRGSGFIFQDSALWANSTIRQNLSLPLRFHFPALTDQEIERRIGALVAKVGFHESLGHRPAESSSGERKIISFLRALVTDPALLYMDEPLTGIDHQTAERMTEIMRELKRAARTIIMVTHDPVLTSQLADYLVVLDAGRILDCGPLSQVVKSTRREVIAILSRVLSEASTFDGSILDLLDQGFGV